MFWKTVRKLIYILLAAGMIFLIYYMLTSSEPIGEPAAQIMLMPDDEFAENPVLFRTEDGTLVAPVIDRTNCKRIIASITPPDQLYWEVSSTLYSGSGSLVRTGRYYKRGSSYRAELRLPGGAVERRVISNGRRAYIEDADGHSRTVSDAAQYTPEAVLAVPDLDFFLKLDEQNITEARLETYNGYDCLYVECRFSDLNMVEKYYLSLTYGLPLSCESSIGGATVYSLDTVTIDQREVAADTVAMP